MFCCCFFVVFFYILFDFIQIFILVNEATESSAPGMLIQCIKPVSLSLYTACSSVPAAYEDPAELRD